MDANNKYPQIILWDEGDINMDIIIFFSGMSYHLQSEALQEVPIYQQVPTQQKANLPEVKSPAS
jgi:hypothetical protein